MLTLAISLPEGVLISRNTWGAETCKTEGWVLRPPRLAHFSHSSRQLLSGCLDPIRVHDRQRRSGRTRGAGAALCDVLSVQYPTQPDGRSVLYPCPSLAMSLPLCQDTSAHSLPSPRTGTQGSKQALSVYWDGFCVTSAGRVLPSTFPTTVTWSPGKDGGRHHLPGILDIVFVSVLGSGSASWITWQVNFLFCAQCALVTSRRLKMKKP